MNEAMKPAPSATVAVGNAKFGNDLPFALMAGRCVLGGRARVPAIKATGKSLPYLAFPTATVAEGAGFMASFMAGPWPSVPCLLYTSDAADDLLCVDLGGS